MRDAELLRYLILGVQRDGNRLLANSLRPLRVTPSQAEALRVLQDHGPLTLKGVGAHLICETGSPSRLLSTLVDIGLVRREEHPHDGRAVRLQLTAAGNDCAEQIRHLESQLYNDIDRRTSNLNVSATTELLRALLTDPATSTAINRRETSTTTS